VYDGIFHFLLSPDELFPVIAFSLFAGLRGRGHARCVLFLLPGAWLLGGIVGTYGLAPTALAEQAVTGAVFLLAGGLLAADIDVPAPVLAAIVIAFGLTRGVVDMAGLLAGTERSGGTGIIPLVGIDVAVFVLVALTASLSLPLQVTWMRVAVRYAGSCISALGLLLVGWSIHMAQLASR